LPFEEQLYWKSFNEPPKGPISHRAFKTDFKGEWDLEYDPLQSLEQILQKLNETKINWWILREKDMITKVHYPVTDSADEWAKEIHNLHKLLIEGFEISDLRNRLINLGGQFDSQWKSLKLIKELLNKIQLSENILEEIIEPLLELNHLRSKISGHVSGDAAKKIKTEILKKHKSFSNHFRHICSQCDGAIRSLHQILELTPE
jgi:hypothetical protein